MLNKCDLNPKSEELISNLEEKIKKKVYGISAKHAYQLGNLLLEINKNIKVKNEINQNLKI